MVAADATIARLAARQKELVTRTALLEAEVSAAAVRHRLRIGRLRRVHPGVYTTAAGPLTQDHAWLAAVLACGPGAGLGDDHAAALWRILAMSPGPVSVVRSGRDRDGPSGVRLRHTIIPELTTHRGIPVTTQARRLLDLAASGSSGRVELALHEAFALRLVTREAIEAQAAAGRGGSRVLRALLEDAPGYTRQGAERLLGRLVLEARLPRAVFNVRVEGFERDAYWAEHRLIVEVAGWAAHGDRRAFERDRARDAQLLAMGYRTIRVTWRQITQEPSAVVAILAAALARS